jgi:DNA processing protein
MPLAWIALNSVNGLGPVRIAKLLEHFRTPEAILNEPADRLCQQAAIPRDAALQLKNPSLFENAQKQLDAAKQSGVQILTLASPAYPSLLKEIFAPPPVLFVKGDLTVFDRHAFAIVGTRKPTLYGKSAAAHITAELVQAGIVIVSGLALGIDTVAHQTCLDKGGQTIAVLGCGIDTIYPSSNRMLAEKICAQGILVSEFPVGTSPEPFNFPRRNRILSGLSAGVLVAEAGEKSGALITANYALQQGREVFAIPGPIFSDKSIGTFNLLKSGAIPARGGQDIIDIIQNIRATKLLTPPQPLSSSLSDNLFNEDERTILSLLSEMPVRLDQLTESAKFGVPQLYDILLALELKGAIKQVAGQAFIKAF